MKMLFMGRKQVAANALRWSVSNGFDVVGVLTDSHLSVSPTTDVARQYGIPTFSYEDLSAKVANKEIEFDVAISMVYWRYIKEPVLSAPQFGIINFHPAPLPEYKGTAGYNLAILNNDKLWAATAHYVDSNIDTGEIIDSFQFTIDPSEETAQSLESKTQPFLEALFKKTLRQVLEKKKLVGRQNQGGSYTSRNQMEEMKKLSQEDDWDKKTRAFWFPPYVGAYIEKDGVKYTVVNPKVLRQLAPKGQSSLFD